MKATKKIVGAAVALVAAVALSAGTTFAWFTSNSAVSISTISATVVTKGGDLRIATASLKTEDDTTTATLGAFSYSLTAPSMSGTIDAVTTKDGLNFEEMSDVTVSGTSVTVNTSKVAAPTTNDDGTISGKYYSVSFALLSSTNMNVYFNCGTTTDGTTTGGTTLTSDKPTSPPSSATVKAWNSEITEANYGKAVSANDDIVTYAKNAARVSFTSYVSNDGTTTASATLGAATTKYWAPYDSSDATSGEGFYKGNLAMDYLIFSKTGSDPATKSSPYYLPENAQTISILSSRDTVGNTAAFVQLAANTPTVVTLNLWIEGQDGDCFNNIFGDTIKLDIEFYGEDVTES